MIVLVRLIKIIIMMSVENMHNAILNFDVSWIGIVKMIMSSKQ